MHYTITQHYHYLALSLFLKDLYPNDVVVCEVIPSPVPGQPATRIQTYIFRFVACLERKGPKCMNSTLHYRVVLMPAAQPPASFHAKMLQASS